MEEGGLKIDNLIHVNDIQPQAAKIISSKNRVKFRLCRAGHAGDASRLAPVVAKLWRLHARGTKQLGNE